MTCGVSEVRLGRDVSLLSFSCIRCVLSYTGTKVNIELHHRRQESHIHLLSALIVCSPISLFFGGDIEFAYHGRQDVSHQLGSSVGHILDGLSGIPS